MPNPIQQVRNAHESRLKHDSRPIIERLDAGLRHPRQLEPTLVGIAFSDVPAVYGRCAEVPFDGRGYMRCEFDLGMFDGEGEVEE